MHLSLIPRLFGGKEERETGAVFAHATVPLVTCILFHYAIIMVNFFLPAERPHGGVVLPVRYKQADLKSEAILL